MARPVPPPRRRSLLVLLAAVGAAAAVVGWQGWGYYHLRAAERAMARGEYAAARTALDGCLWAWPSDGETLLLAARAAARDGDGPAAERLLDAAAKRVPEAAVLERRVLRLRAGELADADRYFAACDAHPDTPEAWLILDGLIEGALKARRLDLAERCLAVWERSRTGPWDRVQATAWPGWLTGGIGPGGGPPAGGGGGGRFGAKITGFPGTLFRNLK